MGRGHLELNLELADLNRPVDKDRTVGKMPAGTVRGKSSVTNRKYGVDSRYKETGNYAAGSNAVGNRAVRSSGSGNPVTRNQSRAEAGRTVSGRPEAGRPVSGRPEAGRAVSGRPEAGRYVPGRVETNRYGAGRVNAGGYRAGRMETGGSGPAVRQRPAGRGLSGTQAGRRKQRLVRNILLAVISVNVCVILLYLFFFYNKDTVTMGGEKGQAPVANLSTPQTERHPDWEEDFLTINENSRPGTPLGVVKNIFVHYTANPGTSAAQNRSYFEQLKDTKETSASSHFIIGYEGEIIQCVPLDEVAYAVVGRNEDSISIECCFIDEDGSFTQETYDSLVSLLKWMLKVYDLDADDVLRHYDSGGKKCPLYYVENEDAWEKLIQDIQMN